MGLESKHRFNSVRAIKLLGELDSLSIVFKLRWVALLGQLLIVWPALKLKWLGVQEMYTYLSIVFSFAVITSFFQFSKVFDSFKLNASFLFFQLSLDVLCLTFLLNLTGGPWNPFASLLLFHGGVGAFFLKGKWLFRFVLYLIVCLVVIHVEPKIPLAMHNQPFASQSLFPAQFVLFFVLVLLLSVVAHLLETQKVELQKAQELKNFGERLRIFGVISAGFSHEFATPLNTLKLRLNRLARTLDSNEDLKAALVSCEKCESSLKLLLSRQLSPETLVLEEFSLHKEVKLLCQNWSLGKVPVKVVLAAKDSIIEAPFASFVQTFVDLLDNALRANNEVGKNEITVAVSIKNEETVSITIEDEGFGFPDIILKNIGAPFFSTSATGSGLGLFHAYTFAKALNGKLNLKNNAAGSAIVELELPRKTKNV